MKEQAKSCGTDDTAKNTFPEYKKSQEKHLRKTKKKKKKKKKKDNKEIQVLMTYKHTRKTRAI